MSCCSDVRLLFSLARTLTLGEVRAVNEAPRLPRITYTCARIHNSSLWNLSHKLLFVSSARIGSAWHGTNTDTILPLRVVRELHFHELAIVRV